MCVGRKAATPSRLRRDLHPPSSPQCTPSSPLLLPSSKTTTSAASCASSSPPSIPAWRSRSYMSPTTSSKAKVCRSVSVGEGLNLGSSSGEAGPSGSPGALEPGLGSPVKAPLRARLSVEGTSSDRLSRHALSANHREAQEYALYACREGLMSQQLGQAFPGNKEQGFVGKRLEDCGKERPLLAVQAFSVVSEDSSSAGGLRRHRRSSSIVMASVPMHHLPPHLFSSYSTAHKHHLPPSYHHHLPHNHNFPPYHLPQDQHLPPLPPCCSTESWPVCFSSLNSVCSSVPNFSDGEETKELSYLSLSLLLFSCSAAPLKNLKNDSPCGVLLVLY